MLLLIALGVMAAIAPAFAGDTTLQELSSREREVDSDGDGKVDLVRTFADDGRLVRISYDLNADGKNDEEVTFDPSRTVRLRDTDLDGEFDERVTQDYSGATLVSQTTEAKSGAQWLMRNERKYLPARKSFQVIEYERDGRKRGEFIEPAELR